MPRRPPDRYLRFPNRLLLRRYRVRYLVDSQNEVVVGKRTELCDWNVRRDVLVSGEVDLPFNDYVVLGGEGVLRRKDVLRMTIVEPDVGERATSLEGDVEAACHSLRIRSRDDCAQRA